MKEGMAASFSLLELIVALALISILAGIATLSYQAIRPTIYLGIAARQIVMDLRVTRMRAIASNVDHRIVFSTGGASYRRQYRTKAGYSDQGDMVALPPGIVVRDCTARDDAIGFRPRGNAGSFGTIVLSNLSGDSRQVIVDIAGRIRVQ